MRTASREHSLQLRATLTIRAILARNATASPRCPRAPPTPSRAGRRPLRLVTHLHKNCTGDLLEALGLLDLNLSQTKLLHRLETAGRELSLGEVAESVGISLPTASRLVDDLVRRGLVERREDAAIAGSSAWA